MVSAHTQTSGPALCYGDTVAFEITASGGVPPYSGTGNYTLPAGIHPIMITDANGCSTVENISVVEPDELVASAAVVDPILCYDGSGVVNISATGGTPPYTGVGDVTVEAGEYAFTVTDANGCSFSDKINIEEPDKLEYTIDSVIDPTCFPDRDYDNGSICISITGGTDPFPKGSGWTNLGGGSWCLENLSAGNYTIDVTDANDCSSTGSLGIALTRPQGIDAYITSNVDADCDNNSIIQTNYVFVSGGVPPYEISWSGGASCDPADPQCMETSVSGTYTAFIHDQESLANGCPPIEVEVEADLPVIGDAAFNFTSANSQACGVLSVNDPITFTDQSTGDIVSMSWDFGDGSADVVGQSSPTHTYTETGTYEVELTVEYPFGCIDTFTRNIKVTKGYDILIPNGFTPNNDGINDTIRPALLCVEEVKMSVYDTWGSLLYVETGTADTLEGWDGNINGTPAENGNYIIVVEGITYNGTVLNLNGPITLIK